MESIYHEEAAELFQLALSATEPYSAFTYSLLHEEDVKTVSSAVMGHASWGVDPRKTRLAYMVKRINARSLGLLEVGDDRNYDIDLFARSKVDFLHRTIADLPYLLDMRSFLKNNPSKSFGARETFCWAMLHELRAILRDKDLFIVDCIYLPATSNSVDDEKVEDESVPLFDLSTRKVESW